MGAFRFSHRAEADLLNITAYTLRTWGVDQAVRYIDDLTSHSQMLADNPPLGRKCDEIRPGLHRMERGRHVIFYREEVDGILISRILHDRMLPGRQAIDDAEQEDAR